MSPYLFIMAVEALSYNLKALVNQLVILGVKIKPTSPFILHLLFVDDTLLFGEAKGSEAIEILNALDMYLRASGQVVNYHKSRILYGKGTVSEMMDKLGNIFHVSMWISLGQCFLGWGVRSKAHTFSWIKEKMEEDSRLERTFPISCSKKIFLKAIIQSILLYVMIIAKLPNFFYDKFLAMAMHFW